MKQYWLMAQLMLISISVVLIAGCSQKNSNSPYASTIASKKQKNNSQASELNIQLGIAYLEKKDVRRAKQKLLLALRQAPDNPAAWYAMAYYLEATGVKNKASEYYQKAIALAPKSGASQNNYGTFLCRNGEYRKAIKHFLLATKDPNYLDTAGAYKNAGICALQIPDKALAQRLFDKAKHRDPRSSKSLLKKAKQSYMKGKTTEAKVYLEGYVLESKHVSPQARWLGLHIGRKLGDQVMIAKYNQELNHRYNKQEAVKHLASLYQFMQHG